MKGYVNENLAEIKTSEGDTTPFMALDKQGRLIQSPIGASPTPTPPSGIVAGAKTVANAGTAEPLAASSTPCKYIIMTAEADNTGNIFYGGSSVSSALGDYLFPAQKVRIDIDDVNKVYIDADTSTDGVKFTYFT